MKKRLPFIGLLFIFCTAGYAKTLGFACVCNPDAPAQAESITTLLETEVFDLCFGHGIITTSAEHSMEGLEQYQNAVHLKKPFGESLDYLVAIYCDYGSEQKNGVQEDMFSCDWRNVHWKLMDFSSQAILFEEKIAPQKLPAADLVHEAKRIGKMIGNAILKKL